MVKGLYHVKLNMNIINVKIPLKFIPTEKKTVRYTTLNFYYSKVLDELSVYRSVSNMFSFPVSFTYVCSYRRDKAQPLYMLKLQFHCLSIEAYAKFFHLYVRLCLNYLSFISTIPPYDLFFDRLTV